MRCSIAPAPPRSPRPSRVETAQAAEQIAAVAATHLAPSSMQEQQQAATVEGGEEGAQLRLVGDLARYK